MTKPSPYEENSPSSLPVFSEKKFCANSLKWQAKKCSDLLRHVLLFCPRDWKTVIGHYNEYCKWSGYMDHQWTAKGLEQNGLLNLYKTWRELAGLGPEKDVLAGVNFLDDTSDKTKRIPWRVFLHNIRSAHNAGSILRTCDGFGWQGALRSGYTPHAKNKSLAAAAMGTEQWIPLDFCENPLEYLQNQKNAGVSIICLDTGPEFAEYDSFEWPAEGILVLGNEELGIPREMLDLADFCVKIPMYGRKNSLNVANAFAVCAAQVRRHLAP